ncbi:8-oxoguanine glycosylase ogg1 [Binucleata daphniae]
MNWQIYMCNEYINLKECLFSGQCFSFTEINYDLYVEVYDSLHIYLRELMFDVNNIVIYHGILSNADFYMAEVNSIILCATKHTNAQAVLDKFFIADLNYQDIFKTWQNTAHKTFKYNGLRLLQVDHIECIFSFICSQNNHIKRISKMVLHLKKVSNNFVNLNFCETDLKNNKFGYRTKYILDAANKIMKHNVEVNNDYDTTRRFLLSIKGIGRKVCDCILLMGFGYYDTVPVDVHIFRISNEMFELQKKLTNINYTKIQNKYKEVYGKYCGIAQLYLFKYSLDNKKQ